MRPPRGTRWTHQAEIVGQVLQAIGIICALGILLTVAGTWR